MKALKLNSKYFLLVMGVYIFGCFAGVPSSFSQDISVLKNHDVDQNIDIAADSLEVHQDDNLAIFKGTVIVTQGNLTMKADNLTVYYDNATASLDPSIARIDATGEVKINSSTERAEGDWGIYDVKGKMITMGGNVLLQRGDNIIIGERLELDLVSGITKVDGDGQSQDRVTGTFKIPKNNNNN